MYHRAFIHRNIHHMNLKTYFAKFDLYTICLLPRRKNEKGYKYLIQIKYSFSFFFRTALKKIDFWLPAYNKQLSVKFYLPVFLFIFCTDNLL